MARTIRRFIWRVACAFILSFPCLMAYDQGLPLWYVVALFLAGGFLMPQPPKDW